MFAGPKNFSVFGGKSYSVNDTNLSYVDLTLDTKFADSNSSSNPKEGRWFFNLNNNLKNVIGYSVLWVNVPFTYHTIDSSCNKFIINEGAGDIEITLRSGTYNAFNVVGTLKQSFETAGLLGYEFVVNQISGKFTVYNATKSFTLKIISNRQNNRLIELFGLYPDNYDAKHESTTFSESSVFGTTTNDSGINVPDVHSITGKGVVDFGGDRIIKFYVDPLRQNEFSSAQDELGSQNALAIIPVNVGFGETITYRDPHPQLVPTFVNSLDSLQVWLTSGDENYWVNNNGDLIPEIALNGQTFQFSIRIFMQR